MTLNIQVISSQNQSEILSIFINGEEYQKIHSSIFGKKPRFLACSSEEEWQKAFEKMEYARTKNYVLRRLSARYYHSAQLIKLLKERLVSLSTITKIIDECQHWGYLNDVDWIHAFVKSHRKKLGLSVIWRKLQQKGIPREEIDRLREDYRDSEAECESIRHLLKTKYRNKDLQSYKERNKVIASLLRKGFNFETIDRAFKFLND